MLGTRNNSSTRYIIYCFSAFCVLGSSIGAFGSVMRLGQQVQQQSTFETQAKQTKDNQLLKLQNDSELAKAQAKANLGTKTDQFIIRGLKQDNFFTLTERSAEAIKNFKSENPMNLLDQHRNVIGTFDGQQVCNLQQICKRIN